MNIKRILIFIAILVVVWISVLVYSFQKEEQYHGSPPYLFFDTEESIDINPATLLDDIRSEKNLELHLAYIPDKPFIMPIDWSQNDFLEVAQAYQKAIWQNDPSLWHLYKVSFDTTCDRSRGKFSNAEFYYYQEVTKNGKSLYSVRSIAIYPEYGYLTWGGDTFFPRPNLRVGTEIDLETDIAKVPAEKVLDLADQRGGNDFRKKENNICNIGVTIFPWFFERGDWSVLYSGETSTEIWIPAK